MHGPVDSKLWLNRPVGYWANQLLRDFPEGPGPKRCGINHVTEIITTNNNNIDVKNFQKAVEATVFNEPHLRTDVDLSTEPATWIPATDFTAIFSFIDLRDKNVADLQGVWSLVEEEANAQWAFGSGKPLYRCTLLRTVSSYVVMNYYHHGACDGTSGMLIMGSILRQYDLLRKGEGVIVKPEEPWPAVEVCTSDTSDDEILSKMVEEKVERLKSYKMFLPIDVQEDKNAINKAYFKDGDAETYAKVIKKCQEMKVTIGALSIAASYLAMAAVHAKSLGADSETYQGMENQYIDIPVNIRPRIEKGVGNSYCGFYITELTTKMSIYPTSRLWDLALEVKKNMDQQIKEGRHLLFSKAKHDFECGPYKDLLASKSHSELLDILVSNMKMYPFEMTYPWGKINSMHTTGSWWTPGFANYVFLIESTDRFHYDMVYSAVGKNYDIAKNLFDTIYEIMENLACTSNNPNLKDIISMV